MSTSDGEARIDMLNLRVLSIRGMSKRDAARALMVVALNRADFLERWTKIHG
ncbi:hypothetical protein NIM87_11885 [Devosia sp. XJ19-1]|uniref:Uncharacterized protein n=1 Tax=Devosia ureilytica TaxID=2952754 RepID=A0A9Q4FTG2_9HYPH|nr:hypothetical protein [Devosia ureilytica]MCP8884207.1 hypothetical protein [Devosia ureilytica]MCP8887815.1 hypothetical protein [Devosia ureilytica]